MRQKHCAIRPHVPAGLGFRQGQVITDEEMIEGLSFPSFRRVATMIMVPGEAPRRSSVEMISIGSVDLADAQRNDASASHE
jgi:hypothetical protein